METGAITGYIDVAQLVLYVFWIFFAGLIYYLHREDKREGYPLESERSPYIKVQGFPPIPAPKTYLLAHGGTQTAPRIDPPQYPLKAEPIGSWPGAPLEPTGNPMLDGVGPGAYALRRDVPDLTVDGRARIVPLRVARDFDVDHQGVDPRGMAVCGDDGVAAGKVSDIWVDRAEYIARYLEVETTGGRRVLLPINFARVGNDAVRVRAILGHQFEDVPATASADGITFLEEEKVVAYYGGGTLYAEPSRREPLI